MNSGEGVKALKPLALVTAKRPGRNAGQDLRVAHLGFFDYLGYGGVSGTMEHMRKIRWAASSKASQWRSAEGFAEASNCR